MGTLGPLVSGEWLAEHINDPNLRAIDFRWYLDGRSCRAAYGAGHIPGAVFVDMDDVTGHRPGAGRHPLPAAEAFERAMRAAGVSSGTFVVAYDDQGGQTAGRLWWMLRYFGHDGAAVLDGGLQAWAGALRTAAEETAPGSFTAAAPREELKVELSDVSALPSSVMLLDARAPERYRGETEPVDPVAGHIPGALNAAFQGNLGADGRFLAPELLRARYSALGISDGAQVVAYCGSGVSACHDILALEIAGLGGARLYPGSWSEWCGRPGAPVATGSDVGQKVP